MSKFRREEDEAPALGFEKRTLDYVLTINQDGIFTGEILEDTHCIVACPPSNKTGKKDSPSSQHTVFLL